jgi:putative colanic acid biosynthesis glycosyltransferase
MPVLDYDYIFERSLGQSKFNSSMVPELYIITITWNDRLGLEATYCSLAEQSCRNFTWLVVDGGSTDGTVEYLKSLKAPAPDWQSEPDNGIYNAMNKGLQRILAKDFMVMFLNGGDRLADADVVSDLIEFCNKPGHKPSFIYGDAIERFDGGERLHRKARQCSWLEKGMFTQHQAMIFCFYDMQKPLYREEYQISSDYAYVYEWISGRGPDSVTYMERPICEFSMGGLSQTKRVQALKEDYEIRVRLMKLGHVKSACLYVLHLLHHFLKSHGGFLFRRGSRVEEAPGD